jgi:hypothetical protein
MNISNTYLCSPNLSPAEQLPHGDCSDCKTILNIGIFFDGTDNSRERDMGRLGHSNIARLYDAYNENPEQGYFRYYIPGVGTSFNEIGEFDPPFSGSPWGSGGESRIVYSLLQVLNSINRFVNKTRLFESPKLAALASEGNITEPTPEQFPYQYSPRELALRELGLSCGLVGNPVLRKKFLMERCAKLLIRLEKKELAPSISGIYLDVFGFSRGATQARVFCNWMYDSMLWDGKLCGVKSYIRMLGLFDTVASIGLSKNGHHSWATVENLAIHPEIKACVHYVALHEFRNNFPLDSILSNKEKTTSKNRFEQLAIGSHSDVGGGYEPGEQGKGILEESENLSSMKYVKNGSGIRSDDNEKISQLALNLMLNSARKSCSTHVVEGNPWIDLKSALGDKRDLVKQFACSTQLKLLAENYFSICGVEAGITIEQAVREHTMLYLAWRYSLTVGKEKKSFDNLPSVTNAKIVDPDRVKYYLRGQEILVEQIAQLKRMAGPWDINFCSEEDYEKIGYHRKAGDIYLRVKKMNVQPDIAVFFDKYVHDSYAGFIGKFGNGVINGFTHRVAEHKLYFTYRGIYAGNDMNLNAQREIAESEPAIV